MQIICPTCAGKGSINDPQAPATLCYSGPNGETCPQVLCMSCGGTGWIAAIHQGPIIGYVPCQDCQAKVMVNPFVVDGWNVVNKRSNK